MKRGTEARVYVDGALALDQSFAGYPAQWAGASNAPLQFGGDSIDGAPFDGALDEIQVYDRALSADDLAATYNRGLGQSLGRGTGPERYYRLDESSGTTAADAGSDGVAATLVSMPASPWITSTAGREASSVNGAAGAVALAYGDKDAQDLTVSVVTQPEHGTVDLTSPSLGHGTYTPDAGWGGSETFTYTVSDGSSTSATRTAWVTATLPDTHTWDGGAGETDTKWSTAANWVGDSLPSDGDTLVFPATAGSIATNDAFLTRIHAAELDGQITVDGSAVALEDSLTFAGNEGHWSLTKTTLAGDVSIVGRSSGSDTCRAYVMGDVEMASDPYGAHSLTLDDDSDMQLQFRGVITGADPACSVTKLGTGMLCLGLNWTTGMNDTWAGPTDLKAGSVVSYAIHDLPDATDVTVEQPANIWLSADFGGSTGEYPNSFSGAGQVLAVGGHLTFSGDSADFTGAFDVWNDTTVTGSIGGATSVGGGTLRGTGTVENATAQDSGHVTPGVTDYAAGLLTAAGAVGFGDAGAYDVDVVNAAGDAGTGFDALAVTGNLLCPPAGSAFTVHVRSSNGSEAHDATGFDSGKKYSWPIVTTSTGSVLSFDASRFVVDSSGFSNALNGGSFGVARSDDGKALELVFTPSSVFTADPVVGDGGGSFPKSSKQAIAWEMDVAPPSGSEFKVVADDPGSSTDVLLATVPATSETKYSIDWTLTQGPSTGWHVTVQLWSAGGGTQWQSADSQTFDIVPATYAITASVVGGIHGHGTISPAGPQTVDWGATPAFAFMPEAGYVVGTVLVDGSPVALTGTDSYTFPPVTGNHAISVSFVPRPADDPPVISAEIGLVPSAAQAAWRRAMFAPVRVTATDPDGGTVATLNWRFVSFGAVGEAGAAADAATATGVDYSVPMQVSTGGVFTAACRMARQGVVQVEYWVTSGTGVESRHCIGYYKLDSSKPHVVARRCTALAGHRARLRYMVVDGAPGDDRDLVRAVVVNGHRTALARAKATNVLANTWRTMVVDTRALGPGRYRVVLRARDAAGNFQPTVTKAWIMVK